MNLRRVLMLVQADRAKAAAFGHLMAQQKPAALTAVPATRVKLTEASLHAMQSLSGKRGEFR
jgi:hypothetical protein